VAHTVEQFRAKFLFFGEQQRQKQSQLAPALKRQQRAVWKGSRCLCLKRHSLPMCPVPLPPPALMACTLLGYPITSPHPRLTPPVSHVTRMDSLFEASFSPLASSGEVVHGGRGPGLA
jgi:hypothetical protein